MFKFTNVVYFGPGADDVARNRIREALRAAGGKAARCVVGQVLPGTRNGGDVIWHAQFPDESAYRAWVGTAEKKRAGDLLADRAFVTNVEGAAYGAGRQGSRPFAGKGGIYRTLLLSLRPNTPELVRKRFETELFAMSDYITTMHRWQLSPVVEAAGSRPWTYVWEQDYASLDGLKGAYMMHPYHWGHIDRWFDPECTDWIVDTHLIHTFCAVDAPVI